MKKLLLSSILIITFLFGSQSVLADTYNNACPYGSGVFGDGSCQAAVTGTLPNTGLNPYWLLGLVLFTLTGLGLTRAGLHLRKKELNLKK